MTPPPGRAERRAAREANLNEAQADEMEVDKPTTPVRVTRRTTTMSKQAAAGPSAPGASTSTTMASSSTTPAPAPATDMEPWEPILWPGIKLLEVYRSESRPEPPGQRPKRNKEGGWQADWVGAKGQRDDGTIVWNVKWDKCSVERNTWESTRDVSVDLRRDLVAVRVFAAATGDEDEDANENEDEGEDEEEDEPTPARGKPPRRG